jgi:hypothetical protein
MEEPGIAEQDQEVIAIYLNLAPMDQDNVENEAGDGENANVGHIDNVDVEMQLT